MKKLVLATALLIATPAFAMIYAFPTFVRFDDTEIGQRSFSEQITVENNGPDDITSLFVMPSCGMDFDVNQGTCFGTLRANQSCFMNVSFSPQGEGYRSCSITISSSNGSAMISLTGNGVKRRYPYSAPIAKPRALPRPMPLRK